VIESVAKTSCCLDLVSAMTEMDVFWRAAERSRLFLGERGNTWCPA